MIARKTAGWAVLVVGIVAVVFSIVAIGAWWGPDESVGDHAATTESTAVASATERVDDREGQAAAETTVETARQKALREKLVVPKIDRDTHREATIPLPEVSEDSENE